MTTRFSTADSTNMLFTPNSVVKILQRCDKFKISYKNKFIL